MFCKAKSARKKNLFLRSDLRPLPNKNVPIWDHFFPLLFPKDSESLKILDIRLREVGAKKCLNGTSKVNRRTDKQTDKQTDISTYRKHRPRGPMLWNFFCCSPLIFKPQDRWIVLWPVLWYCCKFCFEKTLDRWLRASLTWILFRSIISSENRQCQTFDVLTKLLYVGLTFTNPGNAEVQNK